MSSTGDRYEPLPGLLSIPAFLVRRMSPRGRKILALVAAVALVGTAETILFGVSGYDARAFAAAVAVLCVVALAGAAPVALVSALS